MKEAYVRSHSILHNLLVGCLAGFGNNSCILENFSFVTVTLNLHQSNCPLIWLNNGIDFIGLNMDFNLGLKMIFYIFDF